MRDAQTWIFIIALVVIPLLKWIFERIAESASKSGSTRPKSGGGKRPTPPPSNVLARDRRSETPSARAAATPGARPAAPSHAPEPYAPEPMQELRDLFQHFAEQAERDTEAQPRSVPADFDLASPTESPTVPHPAISGEVLDRASAGSEVADEASPPPDASTADRSSQWSSPHRSRSPVRRSQRGGESLRSRNDLRRLVLWSEILAPPLAVRRAPPGPPERD